MQCEELLYYKCLNFFLQIRIKKNKLNKNRSASTSDIYKLKKNSTYDDSRKIEDNQIIDKEIAPCNSGKCDNNPNTKTSIANTNLSVSENNEQFLKNQIYTQRKSLVFSTHIIM